MSGTARWRCPACGGPLTGERLEVNEDDGRVAAVYLIDCPEGDFRAAVTEPDLIRFTSELVQERLHKG